MSHSPCGPNGTKWRRIAPLNRRLGQLELYSQKYTVSPIRGSWMTPLIAPSSTKVANVPLEGRYQPIRFRKASGATHPMVERLNFRLIDFRFLSSPEQRWHRPPDAAQGADQCRQPPL